MAPTTALKDQSNNFCMSDIIDLDILLPNGLFINIEFGREASLADVRHKVWEEVNKLSMQNSGLSFLKKSINDYIFTSVSQDAKNIEYYDYSKKLCDLKLFFTFFKLIEAHGNLEEKSFNSDLSKTVGLYVNEIEQINDEEIIDFRLVLFKEIKLNFDANASRLEKSDDDEDKTKICHLIECLYAPYLEIDPSMLDINIINSKMNSIHLNERKIEINVHISELNQPEITYHLNMPLSYTPTDIITYIIKTKMKNLDQSERQINSIVERYRDTYMLNVCGCDEVFYGNKYKIGSYKVRSVS